MNLQPKRPWTNIFYLPQGRGSNVGEGVAEIYSVVKRQLSNKICFHIAEVLTIFAWGVGVYERNLLYMYIILSDGIWYFCEC